MKINNYLIVIYPIVIGILITILLMQSYHKAVEKPSGSDTLIVYLPGKPTFDSIMVPLPYKVKVHDTIPTIVDTFAILNDYYTIRSYSDTIADTVIQAIIGEEVFQNAITAREFKYRLLRREQAVVTNTIVKESQGIYAGLIAGGNKNYFTFIPSVSYQTKKNQMYGIGYDLMNKGIYLSWSIRIHKP